MGAAEQVAGGEGLVEQQPAGPGGLLPQGHVAGAEAAVVG